VSNSLNPISDLTYRGYDGPLASPEFRWWVIARMTIRKASKVNSLRWAAVLSAWYYVMMIAVLFFLQAIGNAQPAAQQFYQQYLQRMVWKDQFVYGFSYAQHLILIVSLVLGAGAIANDNRANALLVYLSKPCTRWDYVLGKWVGVFTPIFTVIAVPTICFYLYGVFSFKDSGFISQDPWLLPKMMSVLLISASLHTSLILAVSSLFKQGTIAGAVYSGAYFFTFFFTGLLSILWTNPHGAHSGLMRTLLYCSIDGIQIGMAKAMLVPSGTLAFGINIPGRNRVPLPIPSVAPILIVVFGITVVCLGVIWSRVRAVEVVG
jgi:ABC-2 type transport system permease protein